MPIASVAGDNTEMKYYLRLKFSPQSLQYAKCFALRQRFMNLPTDQMLREAPLSLRFTPSFYLPADYNESAKNSLWEELQDVCEDQWDESTLDSLILFRHLRFSSGKKGHHLALETELQDDFYFAHEILQATLKDASVTYRVDLPYAKLELGDQEKLLCQLKLGSFRTDLELETAMNFSQAEIRLPMGLLASSLDVVTTTQQGQTATVRNLFTFIPNKDSLLKEQHHFIT